MIYISSLLSKVREKAEMLDARNIHTCREGQDKPLSHLQESGPRGPQPSPEDWWFGLRLSTYA
jgi:hypothetical protein